jgi:hypothetical protein
MLLLIIKNPNKSAMFKLKFKNERIVRDAQGTTSYRYYYKISGMSSEQVEQYRLDLGTDEDGKDWAVIDEGTPIYRSEKRLGDIAIIKRSMKPNPTTNRHSWYTKCNLEILTSLLSENSAIGATGFAQFAYQGFLEQSKQLMLDMIEKERRGDSAEALNEPAVETEKSVDDL